MKFKQKILVFCCVFLGKTLFAQPGKLLFSDDFSSKNNENWQFFERGEAKIENGVLRLAGCFATAGQADWKNYELKFRARTASDAPQTQIFAGLRCLARDQRYVFGFRGGNHDDLLFWRYGYLGTDDFLAIRPLEFHPDASKSEWKTFRLQVFENQILVFLEEEKQPRISIRDTSKFAHPAGKIVLGGGWLPVEFDDVEVREILTQPAGPQEFEVVESVEISRLKWASRRERYQPKVISKTNEIHQEISLDGDWLFMPNSSFGLTLDDPDTSGYPDTLFINPTFSDKKWHILPVPNFWNENRVWLHGEDAMMLSGDKGVSDNYLQAEIARCKNYTFAHEITQIGFYRHWMDVDSAFFSGEKKLFRLQFDAISKIGEVWVNGNFVGRNVGMFGEFVVDVSEFLHPGKNLLAVKVIRNYLTDSPENNQVADIAVTVEVTKKMLSDLPHGIFTHDPAGIWQPVKLIISSPVHFENVFFKPNLTGANVDLKIKNDNRARQISVDLEVKSKADGSVIFSKKGFAKWLAQPGETIFETLSFGGIEPKLWSPEQPILYELEIKLIENDRELDRFSETVGFRTFEARGDFFYLNNKPYRIRGANHSPMSLRPNDAVLADTFLKKMHDGGAFFTRTTTSPFSEIWLQAADRQGVAVSFEGQWPWLMMRGDIPNEQLLNFWRDEFFRLINKYKNHPSILMWTVNNEMKFYEKDTVKTRLENKFRIISDVVKTVRNLDNTRPVIFDSGYRRDAKQVDPNFIKTIDDGDADDVHTYINWYYYSLFDYFNGEFSKSYKNVGRPLISQEFSSGYPSNDAGHPPRFYSFNHFLPQPLVGRYVFEDHDPAVFLDFQALISKETHEAVRRTCPDVAGLQQFSSICWFKNVFDAQKIEPYPVYHQMKLALQPVLISAELWGRHFYRGDTLRTRFCLINDAGDGSDLPPTKLSWSIENQGVKLVSGFKDLPGVQHFSRVWDSLEIALPEEKTWFGRKVFKLKFKVFNGEKVVSENDYEMLISPTPECFRGNFVPKTASEYKVFNDLTAARLFWSELLFDPNQNYHQAFQRICLESSSENKKAWFKKLRKKINRGGSFITDASALKKSDFRKIKNQIRRGQRVVFLGGAENLKKNFPEIIDSIYRQPAEMISMTVPESPIFQGIEPLDLTWPNNGKREKPLACRESFYISPKTNVEVLAQFTTIHGAINLAFHKREERVREFTGFPLVRVKMGKGEAIFCTLLMEKAATDPVYGQLLDNLLDFDWGEFQPIIGK